MLKMTVRDFKNVKIPGGAEYALTPPPPLTDISNSEINEVCCVGRVEIQIEI